MTRGRPRPRTLCIEATEEIPTEVGWIMRHVFPGIRGGRWFLLVAALWAAFLAAAQAAELNFVVQPIIDREATRRAYQPLADYIGKATGRPVTLITAYDFADFWFTMKQGKRYNLILDSAFYTAWRIKHQGWIPLAKVPGLVSYSLVSLPNLAYFEADELVGKRIASLIPPSPGGLVLSRMFPKATRQPVVIPVKDSRSALEQLYTGKVQAAMVPTPLVARAMADGRDLIVVATSEQFPHITLSAAPSVDAATRQRIKKALLSAAETPAGQEMLKKIGFAGFEKTEPARYKGYDRYLEEGWVQ